MVKPLLKWAGGKRQLLGQLISRLPPEWNTYYEPFVGGGALLCELYNLGLLRRAVISDLNKELINFYQVVQSSPDKLADALCDDRFKNDRASYLAIRDRFNAIRSSPGRDIERAALFCYLNRHCYNGLWRVNQSGEFNVPFGRYKKPSMPTADQIAGFSRMLQNVEIMDVDFAEAVKSARAGDFVYFDPPYQPVSKTAYFTSYTADGFDTEEQARLAELCKRLRERGVYVMVSNSNMPEIRGLYEGFEIEVVGANRSINSRASRRKGTAEVIMTSYPRSESRALAAG